MRSSVATTAPGDAGAMTLWPQEDLPRLLDLLPARSVARMSSVSVELKRQFQAAALSGRKAEEDPANFNDVHRAQQAILALEHVLAQATRVTSSSDAVTWKPAWDKLQSLEASLHTEMRYVYGVDWDVKPGRLVSKKGTWLKVNTRFSWELTEGQKLYMPQGVVMPVLQIGKVVDRDELKRHEWVGQHLRVWLKPPLVRTLQARQAVWFVYWPHFENTGPLKIVSTTDTWLKRATSMSAELQPFELVYMPKGMTVHLTEEPSLVEEEWEKYRHQHVHLHRKVVLASPPLTVKQDQYDIFVGHVDDSVNPLLKSLRQGRSVM